jgi:hypothetical protein
MPAPQPCPAGSLLLVDYIGHCLCQQGACLGNSSDMLLLHAVRMSRTLFLVSDQSNRDLFLFFFGRIFCFGNEVACSCGVYHES